MSTNSAANAEVGQKKDATATKDFQDIDMIEWDGPKDPSNPRNWSSFKRTFHVVIVSMFTLYG